MTKFASKLENDSSGWIKHSFPKNYHFSPKQEANKYRKEEDHFNNTLSKSTKTSNRDEITETFFNNRQQPEELTSLRRHQGDQLKIQGIKRYPIQRTYRSEPPRPLARTVEP
jgi:hypothetical protein